MAQILSNTFTTKSSEHEVYCCSLCGRLGCFCCSWKEKGKVLVDSKRSLFFPNFCIFSLNCTLNRFFESFYLFRKVLVQHVLPIRPYHKLNTILKLQINNNIKRIKNVWKLSNYLAFCYEVTSGPADEILSSPLLRVIRV